MIFTLFSKQSSSHSLSAKRSIEKAGYLVCTDSLVSQFVQWQTDKTG